MGVTRPTTTTRTTEKKRTGRRLGTKVIRDSCLADGGEKKKWQFFPRLSARDPRAAQAHHCPDRPNSSLSTVNHPIDIRISNRRHGNYFDYVHARRRKFYYTRAVNIIIARTSYTSYTYVCGYACIAGTHTETRFPVRYTGVHLRLLCPAQNAIISL